MKQTPTWSLELTKTGDVTTLRLIFAFSGDFERYGDLTTVTAPSSRIRYNCAMLIPVRFVPARRSISEVPHATTEAEQCSATTRTTADS